MSTDDFLSHMWAQDLADDLEAARAGENRMSVREYATARGIQPQLVYYYVRQGYIDVEPCPGCGRKVIDVKSADDYIAAKAEKDKKR